MSRISTLAVLRPHPDDSVPTSVAVGPDGAYYVGELAGFPPVPAAANVYRVRRASRPPEECLTGFMLIIDIAFDERGNLYVLQYDGNLFRVDRDRSVIPDRQQQSVTCAQYTAGEPTTVVTGLANPTSVAVGPDGALYISNRGILPETGEVIRYEPPLQ